MIGATYQVNIVVKETHEGLQDLDGADEHAFLDW
jgi:hypothetical protein